MEVLKPVEITSVVLASSSVSEDGAPAWVSGTDYAPGEQVLFSGAIYECGEAGLVNSTTDPAADPTHWTEVRQASALWVSGSNYAEGALVHRVGTHRVYECKAGGVTGSTVPPELDSAHWINLRSTNLWAMFDAEVNTQTVATSPLAVVLQPGFVNCIGLAGLDGSHLAISVLDEPGGTEVFAFETSLEDDPPGDWYEWLFDPFRKRTDIFVDGLPPYYEADITVTITNTGGAVRCGIVRVGDLVTTGNTLRGAQAKLVDQSYVGLDEFGKTVVRRRASTRDMAVRALLTLAEANAVMDTLSAVLGVPTFILASRGTRYRALRVFGLLSADMAFAHKDHVLLSMDAKGVI